MTFQVQARARKPVIVLTFSGHYVQFQDKAKKTDIYQEWLTLERTMSYSRYRITNPSQLAAAALFVKWGFEYYNQPLRRAASVGLPVPPRGISLAHTTILRWVQRFTAGIREALEAIRSTGPRVAADG